jgi:hypothetical protein
MYWETPSKNAVYVIQTCSFRVPKSDLLIFIDVLDRFQNSPIFRPFVDIPKKHVSKFIPVDFSIQTIRNAVEVEVTDEELPTTRGLALYLVASAVRLGAEDLQSPCLFG